MKALETTPLVELASSSADAQPSPVRTDSGGPPQTKKTITRLGSFSLLINNLIGPAMLGFPNLFQRAGLVPSIVCILFICVCASLSGTLLADAIASIPGNRAFSRNVDFSSAFRLIMGEDWYIVAETLFLVCCVVTAVAGIVETAQSIDGFFASILLGRTYALQLSPQPELVSWDPARCRETTNLNLDSSLEDCTPFNEAGPFIISLGFLCTTALFLPMGRGNLQETIGVQIIAFGCMVVLLSQFTVEFVSHGFPYEVPLFTPHVSNLAGFVLFNYAFVITVPAWLTEKREEVSVNKLVWGASSLASVIYIAFGIMGAMTFQSIGSNSLVLLTSDKVHSFTRICAAFFGISIIGSGVPVLCVIIRTALFNSKLFSYPWALFMGSVAPYLVCWTLYQGSALAVVLNWTGLIVNGSVAFLLPMMLVLRALDMRRKDSVSGGSGSSSGSTGLGVVGSLGDDGTQLLDSLEEAASASSSTPGVSPPPLGASSSVVSACLEGGGSGALTDRKHKGGPHSQLSVGSSKNLQLQLQQQQQQLQSGGTVQSATDALLARSPCPTALRSEQHSEAGRVPSLDDPDSSPPAASVRPLPVVLEPYRRAIVMVMIACFAAIMLLTIVNDVFFSAPTAKAPIRPPGSIQPQQP